jgi:ABC-type multidrug transport system ATPase subunit
MMTVRECIEFAAYMKLKGTKEEKVRKADEVIQKLRLHKCQNNKIGGNLLRGVSGGERKRTSIGVEIITDPSLIFLDEPTTGLDSYTAQVVVNIMKEMSLCGQTVISTIHQPNSDIFNGLDRLLLIANGKIIYFNDSKKAVNYFTSIGNPCPDLTNPADFFMQMMSRESLDKGGETTVMERE